MRTTITLDDDIFDLTKHLAEQRRISLSDAVNLLIKRGLASSVPYRERNGFAVFDVSDSTGRFGLEDIEKALSQEDLKLESGFSGR
jgi:hypothetical protein